MPKGGVRPNSGRKPIWDTEKIRKEVSRLQRVWWTQIEEMMESANDGERKFALTEFNKLQIKAMPQAITGEGGGAVQISLSGLFNATVNEQ